MVADHQAFHTKRCLYLVLVFLGGGRVGEAITCGLCLFISTRLDL